MKRYKATVRLSALLVAMMLMLSSMPVFASSDAAESALIASHPHGITAENAPEIVFPEVPDSYEETLPETAPPRLRKAGDVIAEGVEDWCSYTIMSNDDGEGTCTLILGVGTYGGYYNDITYFYGTGIYETYKDSITRVKVSEGVGELSEYCFYDCTSLLSVSLPSTLNTIGKGAFTLCYCLNDISCPAPVSNISDEAFASCGYNAPVMVNKNGLTAVDEYYAVARMCYPAGSLPPGIEESEDASAVQFKAVYDKVRQLLDELDVWECSDITKVKRIYEWVTSNVTYDFDALDDKESSRFKYAASAHSALFAHKAICQGYVNLTKMMLNEAGIDCVEMTGDDHVWLVVRVDGKWYPVDDTWDAGLSVSDYFYFLRSMANFNDHIWESYNGMVREQYPIASEDYGKFSQGNYEFTTYGSDYVAISGYKGDPASIILPKTVEYGGETLTINAISANAFNGLDGLANASISYNGTKDELSRIDAHGSWLFDQAIQCTDGAFLHPYNLAFAKITLSQKTLTYNGKVQRPAVTVTAADGTVLKEGVDYQVETAKENGETCTSKDVRDYALIITGCENQTTENSCFGANYDFFTIRPQPTSLKKVVKKSKAFTAYWKKQATQVSGYQIQYALNSKFTKGKKTVTVASAKSVSKTVKKLKSKKLYYVRIRTYKTNKDFGYKTYSAWSKALKVKTK